MKYCSAEAEKLLNFLLVIPFLKIFYFAFFPFNFNVKKSQTKLYELLKHFNIAGELTNVNSSNTMPQYVR